METLLFIKEKYFGKKDKNKKEYNEEAIEHEKHEEPDEILRRKRGNRH